MNETKINVIVPCYNAGKNLDTLASSLLEQKYDNWQAFFVDDLSSDDTWDTISNLCEKHDKFIGIKNTEKKWALKNIVDTCYNIEHKTDEIVTIVDGDDALCNPDAFSLLNKAFQDDALFIWTKHKWDIDGRNISQEFPVGRNPYATYWVTSHLRAFSLNLLKQVNTDNFKDVYGAYFKRAYDRAITYPLVHLAQDKIKFIPEVCYLYNIRSCSMPDRNDGGEQLTNTKFIIARGFIP